MHGYLRLLLPAATALALAAIVPPAQAGGTIKTTGATIDAGNAPAKGTVTIDASAPPVTAPALPAVGSLGSIGSISGQIPAFVSPAGGPAFVASPPGQTFPGGTYSYSTYTVPQGATVTYTGAVTIQTSGDVQLDGLVTTGTVGASITFQCGGNFRIISHAGTITTGISATALTSPIVVDVGGTITASTADTSSSWIDTVSGSVTLYSHTQGGVLSLSSIAVRARSAGSTLVQSAGAVTMPGSGTIRADLGDVTVQAYSGLVQMTGSTMTAGNNLLVEATGGVIATQASALTGQNTATVVGYGSDVKLTGGTALSQSGGTGDVTVRANNAVDVSGASSILETGLGDLSVTAFGGSLSVEAAGAAAASFVHNFSAKDVFLRASGGVVVAGTSQVTADNGNVTLASTTGSISFLGDAAVSAPNGTIDARAESGVTSQSDAAVSQTLLPSLAAQSLLVRGGDAGISLAADPVTTPGGSLTLVAGGAVQVGATLAANGTLTVQSMNGDVTLSGQKLSTGSAGAKSGDIVIESYGGSSAKIDATNATVRSGDDPNASGDVALKVHAAPLTPSVGSLVPQQVKVRLKKKDLAHSHLTAIGVIDTGPDAVDLTGDATLTVGGIAFPVTLAADAAGRPSYRGGDVSVRLTPSKSGSSRTVFRFDVTGDFRGTLDDAATGAMTLEFQHGTLDAKGTVRLLAGVYVRGRRRAALVTPDFYVVSARATVKGGSKDRLDLVAGFSTDGTTPSAPPDMTVTFGGTFSVAVPSKSFKSAGIGRFAATDPAHGVSSLVVDYHSETVTFHGRGISLGTIPPGLAIHLVASVTFGDDARGADIRVAHLGTSLVY
jgi:hypothetical protein